MTLTGANAPYYGAASVSFSSATANDGSGSGLDLSTRSVTRETGDLVAGACSNFSADAGSFSSPDTAVSSGHCYRYTFTIADRVGNVSPSVTATAKVDTDAPIVAVTAPTELTGAGNQYYDAGSQTQFFRPAGSGSFTLHATASDGQSGVAQVAFPNVSRRQRLGRLDRRRRQHQPLQLPQRLQLELRRDRTRRPLDHRDQRRRDRRRSPRSHSPPTPPPPPARPSPSPARTRRTTTRPP